MQSSQSPKVFENKIKQELESILYKNNYYVDVRDMSGSWIVGKILEVNPEEMILKIRLEGTKQESKYKFNSERIAPFRLFTKSYNSHRFGFATPATENDLENYQKKVMDFDCTDEFLKLSPIEITQELRGGLFYFIESLVPQSQSSSSYNEKNVLRIMCFFALCVKMIAIFLQKILQHQKEFINALINPNLFLEKPEAAFCLSIFEFLETLLKFFGENEKFNYFFKDHNNLVSDVKEQLKIKYLLQIKPEGPASFNFFRLFKLIFSTFSGFKSLSIIMNWYKTDFPVLIPDPNSNVLTSLWRLLEPVHLILKYDIYSEPQLLKTEFENSLNIIFHKLKNLTDKEIKDVDRELIMRMFHFLEINGVFEYRDLENLELEIYRKYIFSQYFEKKFKALNDLREFLERAELASKSNFQKGSRSSSAYKDFSFTRYYTIDLIINWVLEQKVLENALKNATQIDIIKRCQDIIKFLANYSVKFPNNLLIFLWGMMEEAQYEDIKRGYQDILEDLASLLDQEGLDFIFGKIEESLMENIKNEGYFSFLRKFFCKSTLKTRKLLLEQISSRTVELNSIPSSQDLDGNPNDAEEKKSQDIKKTIITQKDDEDDSFLNEENLNLSKFFGIDLIWRLIQDSSPFTVVKINDCLEFFIELLKKANIKVLFRKYFELCLENIFSNKSVYQSLYLMKEILNSIQNEWSNLDFALFLTRIQDRYGFNLIDIILKEMLVSHAQRGNKEANSQNSQSRYSYSEIYKMHLNLFQFLKNYTIGNTRSKENTIQNNNNAIINNVNKSNNNSNNGVNKNNNLDNNPFNITYEHINTLWSLSVIQAHHPNEAIEFLKSFLNESSNFSPSIMKCFDYVFLLFCKYLEEKISSNQLKTVSDDIFSCFFLYYKHCNINHKNFELTSDNIYNLCEEDSIIGFKTLWSLFLACEQEKILHDCIQHLVMVYGTLGIDIFGKRTEIFRIFLKKCLYNLREAIQHKKVNLVQKVLRLIDTFTVTIEKKKFSYAKSRNNSNYILIKPNNEKFESFHFNATLPVKYLRLKIAEVNELPLESFIIVFNQANMEISRDYDDHKTSCFVNNDLLLYCVLQEIKLESPKVMLSENMEFIKTFFELFELDFTEEISNTVWNLISKLPINTQMKNELLNLDSSNCNNEENLIWENFFTSKNIYKMQYYFQIFFLTLFEEIKGLATKTEVFINWFSKFKDKGIKNFLQIFSDIASEKFLTPLKKSLLRNIVKSLNYFMFYYEDFYKNSFYSQISESELYQFSCHTLVSISNLINYSILREENNLENCHQQKSNLYNYPFSFCGKTFEFFEIEWEICDFLTKFLLEIFNFKPDTLEILYTFKDLEILLYKGIFRNDNHLLKESIFSFIQNVFLNQKFYQNKDLDPRTRLGKVVMLELLRKTEYLDNSDNKLTIFFSCYRSLFEKIDLGFLEENKIIGNHEIFDYIYEVISAKKHGNSHLVIELLFLLGLYLSKKRQFITVYVKKYELIQLLSKNFVFSAEKNKNQTGFEQVMKVLLLICQNSFENLEEFIGILNEKMKEGLWRSDKKNSWEFHPNFKEKSITGYVGLKNLGCICYMNSIFQQLYMIPIWRNAILEIQPKDSFPEEENILKPLKEIFSALYLSDKQYVNPKRFCASFRDENGNPICVNEQKDTFEFFSLFIEKLEVHLKDTPYQSLFKMTFEGVLCNQLICKECPHSSERDEAFLGLNIEVKNKKNLSEGLAKFIESEVLEGDNAYFCEQCKRKVNTIKRQVIKKLPNHIMFVLKRFEFDFETFNKVKINDFYEFPEQIDMKPYTVYQDIPSDNIEPEYFQYKLAGVIIHLGIADAGHYYSLIQDRYVESSNRWVEFNDTNVKNFDSNHLANECFGFDERNENSNYNLNRFKNAYILIYDRKKLFMEDHQTQNSEEIIISKPIKLNKELVQTFELENRSLIINKVLFNKELFGFFLNILPENSDNKLKIFEKCQYVIDYFLFVLLRFWEKHNYTAYYFMKIKEYLDKNYEIARWFLKIFTDLTVLKEFFFECPIHEVRSYVTVLIKTAIHTLVQKEKILFSENAEDGLPLSSIANFINCYISQLFVAKNYPLNLWHYFNLLNVLANINLECAQHMLSKKIIARFYCFFFDKQFIDKQFPDLSEETGKLKDMSDCPFRRVVQNEIKTGGFRSRYCPQKRNASGKGETLYSVSHMSLEFFWKTISDLIIYCKFPNDSIINQAYRLSDIENNFLKADKIKCLMNVWETADNLKTAKSIGKIYSFVAKEDQDFGLFLSKFYCTKILQLADENSIRYMLKGLWYFINIQDSLTKNRMMKVLDMFVKKLQKTNLSPKLIELHFKFILAVGKSNNLCQEILLEMKVFHYIISYVEEAVSRNTRLMPDMSKAERKQVKIIRKKFESIYEEAWKLHHQNSQIDANSEEEDYLNDETSEGFEEHEEISYYDRNNNKNYTARIEEKIDNFLLKIKIENKDINQKGRTLIIVDKNSECIGKKNANYSGDLDPAISSTTKEQSNSDDLETQANKSMKSELAF